jgi:uncharacterized protein (TIGR04141 family)
MSKIATKLFRLNPELFAENIYENLKQIRTFMQNYNDTHDNRYVKKEVKQAFSNKGFQFELYVQIGQPKKPEWVDFLYVISQDDLQDIKSQYPSYILFILHEKSSFALTGGAGSKIISQLLDPMFGFNILERLIDVNNTQIRSIAQNTFLGSELASARYFKSGFTLTDEDNFGKYYKELCMFIDPEKLKKIGIVTSKEKLLARGESGFKIDTKISFANTIERIVSLIELLNEEVQTELNPFRRLSSRELGPIKHELETQLIDAYYEDYCRGEEKELFHPNLIDFLQTEKVLFYSKQNNFEMNTSVEITLQKIFTRFHLDFPVTRDQFQSKLKSIETQIYDAASNQYSSPETLLNWLFGEVFFKDKKYIKFEGAWFTFSTNYETDLHTRIDYLNTKVETIRLHPWTSDYGGEGDYNDDFSKYEENCIVGDTCFYKNIEIADAILWNDNEINFVHVKDKLDRNLRVLQSQIINSSKQIRQFRQDLDHPGVKEYYDQLTGKIAKKGQVIIPFEEFKELLQRNEVYFSFCFATNKPSSSLNETLNEIKRSNSTIAKLAILDTYYSLKNQDFKMKVGKIVKIE